MIATAAMSYRCRVSVRLLAVVLCTAAVCAAWRAPALAQEATHAVEATPTPGGPTDEFDRGVPRTTMQGFLQACRDGDYKRAAEYLDLGRIAAKDRATKGPALARHLKVVFDHALWVDPEALSDDPEGEADDGLPPRRDRAGTIHTAKDPVDVLLERVPRADGVLIWKIAAATVAKIPGLYQEFGYGPFADVLPAPFFEITFLNVELWQWIGLGLVIALAVLLSWGIAALIARLVRPLVVRLRQGMEDKLEQLIVGPLRLGLAISIFFGGTFFLGLSLPVQAFFRASAKALVIAAVTWLALRLIDIFALRMEDRFVARGRATAVAVVPLGRRTAKVFLAIVALLALLQNLGFNVTGLLAGLGVGGLAVALAAQETVKNFFGGVALIADQPVRVGDLCRFGDKMGTVEDISLWSTRIRTLDRTVVSIPNAQFSGMQLENLTRRDRIWLHTMFGLPYDTTPEQVRTVLAETKKMLQAHPKMQHDTARVRFTAFSATAFRIEIFAYALTPDIHEFRAVREDLFLQILDIVKAAGAKFAAP